MNKSGLSWRSVDSSGSYRARPDLDIQQPIRFHVVDSRTHVDGAFATRSSWLRGPVMHGVAASPIHGGMLKASVPSVCFEATMNQLKRCCIKADKNGQKRSI